ILWNTNPFLQYSKNNHARMNSDYQNKTFDISEQIKSWDTLKLSIATAIEKLNPGNIRCTRNKLLRLNIVRGKGLFCRFILNAQLESPETTHMYATLVSYVNLQFPNVVELLLIRYINVFKNAYKYKQEYRYKSPILFLMFMINHNVAKDWLAMDIIKLLIPSLTVQSMEMIEVIFKECGKKLYSNPLNKLDLKHTFGVLQFISQEARIDSKVQRLARIIITKYRDHNKHEQYFGLVDPFKQYTHLLKLNCEYDGQYELDYFAPDLDYMSNDIIYENNIKQALKSKCKNVYHFSKDDYDEMADDEDEHESETNNCSLSSNIAIKKTIKLIINLNLSAYEIVTELMQIKLKPGQEMKLCLIYLDCCFENSVVYNRFFGDIIQCFCIMNDLVVESLECIFMQSFPIIHLYNPNKLVNFAKFFAQLLYSDSISWKVFTTVRLTESETTYSSRVYLKTMFNELIKYMGRDNVKERILCPSLQTSFIGLFSFNTRGNFHLCNQFFTDIGFPNLIAEFRESLRGIPV
ncbi:pre-mRNA-splicing factor CWC22, partial [Aphis craccivora]